MALPSLARISGLADKPLPTEPAAPAVPPGQRIIYLLDSSTGLEDAILDSWVRRIGSSKAAATMSLASSRIRRPTRRTDQALDGVATAMDEPWVVPLRVVWSPSKRRGRRSVSWVDVLKLGDPRDPRWFRDYLILALRPDRVRIVVGEGASATSLASDHEESVEYGSLADYVRRRAWRALDRAERAERGDRYKVPKFVAEDIVARPRFRDEAIRIGSERGLPEPVAIARARYYLGEIAASHSPFVIDLIANFIHWIYREAYGAINYDPATIERIAALGRDHPLAFLPSHRSNMDRLALQFLLWENDLPPNHTAGGINMNFFPFGPLLRRTGVFFIRRSFKDNDLYKFVLTTYLDYLIERRFPLEWYMEGGRSRTGKLRPPRYGMLAWVVDSLANEASDDLYLLPMSIAYDQIQDVAAYASEASGGSKEKESFSWALKFITSLRQRYGDIHVTFAEPISVRTELDVEPGTHDDLAIQKLAFEVMYRIGSVTPFTPTSVLSIVLLQAKGDALDAGDIAERAERIARYVGDRGLLTTAALDFSTPSHVRRVLSPMLDHGLVSTITAADRTVYWMDPGQSLKASYYRNTVVHFFVPRGIAEIAMSAPDVAGFWSDALALRDLLKFEFFFADRDTFTNEIQGELASAAPDWQERLGRPPTLELSAAGWAIQPLLESYMVVADELAHAHGGVEKKPFMAECLARARLYRLEGSITSDESVNQALFEGAWALAQNRELIEDRAGVEADRKLFADEVAEYVGRCGGES